MITLEQTKQLRHGDILTRTANGKTYNWKVNGKVKLWKRDASRVSVPLKHGLFDYFTLTEHDLHSFDPPVRMQDKHQSDVELDADLEAAKGRQEMLEASYGPIPLG